MIAKAFLVISLGLVVPAWIIVLLVLAVSGGMESLAIGGGMSIGLAAVWIKGRGLPS